MAMENFTSNFRGNTSTEILHGRRHRVVPVSMIVPGVLNGSLGPLLYPSDEIARNPEAWNGIPIVVDHPRRNGQFVSARLPGVSSVGTVRNARIDKRGRLVAEGWFDVLKAKAADHRILQSLDAGKPVELSTGLFCDNSPSEGVYNGKAYKFIAKNYRPDHLAILLDDVGACSILDGCGVGVNHEGESMCNCAQCNNQSDFRKGGQDMIPPDVRQRMEYLTTNQESTERWPGGVGSMVPPSLNFAEIARQNRHAS